jgi:hypothetical protein
MLLLAEGNVRAGVGEVNEVWPVGIDTERWRPRDPEQKAIDVLLYEKVMWSHDPSRSERSSGQAGARFGKSVTGVTARGSSTKRSLSATQWPITCTRFGSAR